jgi:peptide/nickel transport system substrate-binding protein
MSTKRTTESATFGQDSRGQKLIVRGQLWIRRLAVVAPIVAVAFVIAGCGSSSASPSASRVLTFATPLQIGDGTNSMDPALNCCLVGTNVLGLAYEPIIYTNPDGSFGPGLATSWRYLPAAQGAPALTRFEFTLRHNARFSDGSLVTAPAVKTWLAYFLKAGGPALGQLDIPVKSITTSGEWDVLITLTRPISDMPGNLSDGLNTWGSVAAPSALQHASSLNTHSDGAGPYVIDSAASVPGSEYTFVPNKYYYDKSKIYWKQIVVKYVPSASSRLAALSSGEIQVAEDEADISTAATALAQGLRVLAAPGSMYTVYFADLEGKLVKPLASTKVRQALSYAIDRPAITRAFFGKYGAPTSEQPLAGGWVPSLQNYYSYDPTKAKALLAAAGYPHGFRVSVMTGLNDQQSVDLAQAVAADWAKVGVSATINTNPASLTTGKFAVFSCNACVLAPMTLYYITYWKLGGLLDQHGWSDPALEALYNAAQASSNPDVYWQQMMTLLVKDAYAVPVAKQDLITVYSPTVTGVSASVDRGYISLAEIKPS